MASHEEYNAWRVVAALWRYRVTIVISTLLCGGLASGYAFTAARQYRAEVLLAASDPQAWGLGLAPGVGQLGNLAAIADFGLGASDIEKDIAVARLTSRGLLEEFVEANNLLPILFSSRWDPQGEQWKPSLLGRAPGMDDAIELLRRRVVAVKEDRRSGLVSVSVTWVDRELVAKWANELVARVNDASRASVVESARRNQAYLNAELQRTDVQEVRDAINRLLESQLKTQMIATVRSDYALRTIDAAHIPDSDSFVRPKRFVLILLGGFVGLGLGLVIALIRNATTSR